MLTAVADPEFPGGRGSSPKGGLLLLFGQPIILAKLPPSENCMKMKEIGPEQGTPTIAS